MSIRLSIDDGCASDTRVADMAIKYDIETIFYWPVDWHLLAYNKGYEPLSYYHARDIVKDFELGSHTITHRHLTDLSFAEAAVEIAESRHMLEDLFDRIDITKFCPPRGYTNKALTDFTMMHYQSQRLTKGSGLVHIHPDSGANENRPWRECIDENITEIWGHSWEIDKYDLWQELEEVLSEHSPS